MTTLAVIKAGVLGAEEEQHARDQQGHDKGQRAGAHDFRQSRCRRLPRRWRHENIDDNVPLRLGDEIVVGSAENPRVWGAVDVAVGDWPKAGSFEQIGAFLRGCCSGLDWGKGHVVRLQ
jgi:hypothetical protein